MTATNRAVNPVHSSAAVERRATTTGDEVDAYSPRRHHHRWPAGVRAAIKARTHRRERRARRADARRQAHAPDGET